MFNFLHTQKIYKGLLLGILALNTLSAEATLTSYNSNGVDLVYSSVSDVTWTKDGNLLGKLFATQDFNTVVNAIIAASPIISSTPNYYSPLGTYTITTSDFSSNGRTSWFGALAYVNYLNSINFANSNQWVLPTVANTIFGDFDNIPTNGTTKGDELVELFYSELSGTGFNAIPNTPTFDNEQFFYYWSGTEYAPSPSNAWVFNTSYGFQDVYNYDVQFYVWAVSPSQILAVPEPESIVMFFAGLGFIGVVVKRKR